MSLLCLLLDHDWRCHGGVARDVLGDGRPANVQYGCNRCGKRRTVYGIETRVVANNPVLMSNPDMAEKVSRDVDPMVAD